MNIYELLQEIVVIQKQHISMKMFTDDKKHKLNTEAEKKLFDLLKNIYSLFMQITDNGVKFDPYIILNGKRSFSLEDMTDQDYATLLSLDLQQIPLPLRARIADILWTQKKDYKSAIIAAKSYLELFIAAFSDNDWVDELDFIRRSIFISAQIKENEIYNTSCQTIYDHIIRIDVQKEDFLLIKLIEIIVKERFGDINTIVSIIDKIIISNKDNPHKIECAYFLKVQCLHIIKKVVEATQTNIELADYYIEFAENILKTEKQGALKAEAFFQKAITLYRNNGNVTAAEITHKRLVEVQRNIPESLKKLSTTVDIRDIVEIIDKNMSGLSFEECIVRLTQLVTFYKKDEIKQQVFEDFKSHVHLSLCSRTFINENGQTVLLLPPLDCSDPEKDPALLEKHIHRKLYETQTIFGNLCLDYALKYIRANFCFQKEDLDFLIEDNAIIPAGRGGILRSAIYMALNGDYYSALNILAPQVENIFRNLAKELGALTVTLENDGTSKEKVLSSIFDLPELIECYDNDILFSFKSLLNEQAGANIRNNIAHGIMTETDSASGASLYFICAFIKFLAFYSQEFYRILASNERLKEWYSLPEGNS